MQGILRWKTTGGMKNIFKQDFHSGGIVPGPAGTNVPAILQSGEFVLDNQAAGMTLHGLQIARQVIDDYGRGGGGMGGGFVNNQPVITTDNSTVVMPQPSNPNSGLFIRQLAMDNVA